MKSPEQRQLSLSELCRGDVIRMYIPFEENTPDYYNGHNPCSIRQSPYMNRRGQSGKRRIVLYMGRDGDQLLYLPITSSFRDEYESSVYQYNIIVC